MYRLLDSRKLTVSDALDVVDHVWAAHACNEPADQFMDREDLQLCALLAKAEL